MRDRGDNTCSVLWHREGLEAEDGTAGIVTVLQQALRDGSEDTGSEGRDGWRLC